MTTRCVIAPPLARKRVPASTTAYALTLQEAKDHLRTTDEEPDAQVLAYLAAASEAVEREIEGALISQQWKVYRDAFWDGDLELPYPPLLTVDSITYVDTDGATQTVATSVYEVATQYKPGRVRLAYGQSWPTPRAQPDAVIVTFTCGYGTKPSDVPEGIRQAVRLVLGHNDANREAVVTGTIATEVPQGARWLLDKYRIPETY